MRPKHKLSYLLAWTTVVLLLGCSEDAVVEDRSINYSRDGKGVGFQHGSEGVFVATTGGKAEKIFAATEDTIAVSSPLWSPVDKRLIFTSAQRNDPEDNSDGSDNGNLVAANVAAWDANPAGRRFGPGAIKYTCLLRPAPSGDKQLPPEKLFAATCDHPGYVAANLAVRWHPSGESILFVDQTAEGQHSLFEFDLATGQTRRILRQSAAALIFDWTPGGSYLVCVLANDEADRKSNGIWIRPADHEKWWKVPQSERLAPGDSLALLEQLRATRPAWTRDDHRFAMVVQTDSEKIAHETEGSTASHSNRHTILSVDAESHEVTMLYESTGRFRDLRWRPNSGQLGFVSNRFIDGRVVASLHVIDESGSVSTVPSPENVRRFPGWNHDGSRLAYVTPEPVAEDGPHWAALFPRDPTARDHVYLADGNGQASRMVHSGVRITFPQWSPQDDSLSLWGTYAPTHRSWLSQFLPWSLQPGDPAAILDCRSGQIHWMAVNAHEEAQVGHYYLLRRDYERAWQWYEKSAHLRPKQEPIRLSQIGQFIRRIQIHQDSTFFEYYCLTKLQRYQEAASRLRQFRQAMSFDTRLADNQTEQESDQDETLQAELQRFVALVTPLIQNAYITEVYLSLDAVEDGVAFFRRELKAAQTDNQRFARALCLSQLLLITGDHTAYADLVTDSLGPLSMKLFGNVGIGSDSDDKPLGEFRRQLERFVLLMSCGPALLPMMCDEFQEGFEEQELHGYLADWRQLREKATNDTQRIAIDLVLRATLSQLGADDQRREVELRIKDLGPKSDLPLKDSADVDRLIEGLRSFSGQRASLF